MINNRESKDLLQKLDKIIIETLVPRFSNDTVRPCEEKDFSGYREKLENNLQNIDEYLDCLIEGKISHSENLFKIIIVIGEQCCQNPWNTEKSVNTTRRLIPKICQIYEHEKIEDIINNKEVLIQIIKFLRPKLLKNTWKSFPAAIVCYKWLLESIQVRTLSTFLSDVLPTALIIFDDYDEENKLIGLYCINKVTELCLNSRVLEECNYHQVIFDALMKETHKIQPNMIIFLYSCISNVLQIIEHSKEAHMSRFGWTKQDDVLRILLDNMELENDQNRRYAYITSLRIILNQSGLGKWSVRLSRVLSEYCEDERDLKTSEASIAVIKRFLNLYQPKDEKFYIAMYSSLLILRYKLDSNMNATKAFIKEVDDCISLLNKLSPSISEVIQKNEILKPFIKAK